MKKVQFKSWIAQAFSLFAVLFLTASFGVAQVTTGNLQGVVKDPNGAVVAGAAVKITNTQTGQVRETTTNDEGFYRVTNLTPGDAYKVEVTATGFGVRTVENVPVRLATENSADVLLSVAGGSENVTVTGDVPLINSTQSQLSTSYTPQQLTQLPFNGGSIDNLALLTPGVVTPGDTDFSNGVGISSNGNRGRSNNFQIDGQDNNDNSVAGPSLTLTNTEAIGEYQIITNNFSAEFGRNAGAQVNVITKPGTNSFHGSLFEYHQNSALDTFNNTEKKSGSVYRFLSQNGFPQLTGIANREGKDPFSYNRFGGSIGGPIKENKAFFFVTYQGDIQNGENATDNLGSGGITFTRASAQAAAGLGFLGAQRILTNTGVGGGPAFAPGQLFIVPALEDTNGDGVPDAYVTGSLYNSEFICAVPGANPCPAASLIPLQTGEAIRILPFKYRQHQIITREDFNLTSKDTLGVRYIYDNTKFPDSAATGTALTGAFFDVPSKNNNLGVTYTRTLSNRFVLETRFNFSRLDVKFGDPEGTLPGPGISFTGTRDLVGNQTSLGFGSANNLPQSRLVDVYQEQATLIATLGNHAIKTGIDFRQQKVENFFLPNFLGVYRFRNLGSRPANTFYNAAGTALNTGTATAFENLLLGRPERITFALGNPRIETSQNDFFTFLQDDWRVHPKLTLNLGVRYEFSTTPFNPIIDDLNAREANASTAIFNTAFPLSARTTQRLPNDKNNISPRVGFAWTPDIHWLGERFTNGRTVIRGGFGIAYDPSYFNIVLNTVTAAPFAAAGNFTQTPGAPGSVTFPFLPNSTAQLNLTPQTNGGDPRLFNQTRVDPNFYSPYTMGWNFGIQQEIFKNTVIEARYVASRLVGQFQTVNGNPSTALLDQGCAFVGRPNGCFTNGFVGVARAGTTGNGRIDPNFGPVRLRTNGATATYHSLQARFDTRFRNDLVLNMNYTWSKTIDNASEIFSTFAGGQSVANPQQPFNSTNGERGLSAFHQKHSFTTNFIYETPWFKDQKGFAGKVLGGYQISGILRIASGRPYSPFEFFGSYDPGFDGAFFSGVGPLRPYNGNPNAPNGTIAYSYNACFNLFFDPACADDPTPANGLADTFVIHNTLNPGSVGRRVTRAQALQEARLIYNDFGLAQFGIPFEDLGAFKLFRTPYGIGRNNFFGENIYTVNMAVFKSVRLTEGTKLEFRVEAANLLNRRNFGVPDPLVEDSFGSTSVGSYQNPGFNAGANRSLRFGLRFIF